MLQSTQAQVTVPYCYIFNVFYTSVLRNERIVEHLNTHHVILAKYTY